MKGHRFFCTIVCATLGMLICQWLIVMFAPIEASMGLVQKLFYIHVPLAWWAFVSFFVVCIAGAMYLRTRSYKWDTLAHAATELGVLFSGLALVTGSIWGRHSWGVWWTWDPRLTTTLVLWFLYVACLLIRYTDMPPERRAVISAVLGIISFVDVPIVFYSARLWRSVHPVVVGKGGGGLDQNMLVTLVACVVALGLVWCVFCALRTRQLRQDERLSACMLRMNIF